MTEPELVRFGMTNGIVSRLRGYERDGPQYLDHVGVIGLRHLPPGTTRRETLDIEAGYIDQYRPPFNIQHNPDHDTAEQEALRLEILGLDIPWQTRTLLLGERVRSGLTRIALWVLASTLGALALIAAAAAL